MSAFLLILSLPLIEAKLDGSRSELSRIADPLLSCPKDHAAATVTWIEIDPTNGEGRAGGFTTCVPPVVVSPFVEAPSQNAPSQ